MKKIPIDWQSIETVFLDLDGTLLDLHYDNHFWMEHMPKCYANEHGVSVEKASEFLLQHADKTMGSLDWYCIDHWEASLGMELVPLKHEVAHKIAIRESVVPFLSFLQKQGKEIVLLTNAHPKTLGVKFAYVDIQKFFNKIITSHEIGLAKEELGFWESLEDRYSFNREESLFIDDNLDVLNNAVTYGVKHILSIAQPDSQKPIQDTLHFLSIKDYMQVII